MKHPVIARTSLLCLISLLAACATPNQYGAYPISTGTVYSQGHEVGHPMANGDRFNGVNLAGEQYRSPYAAQIQAMPSVVYFKFSDDRLSSKDKSILGQHAQFLHNHPSEFMLVAGNTDPLGSKDYNFNLGQRRADGVKSYLLSQGASSHQVCTLSYGDTRLVTNPYGENYQSAYSDTPSAVIAAFRLDRRAELEYGKRCQGNDSHV